MNLKIKNYNSSPNYKNQIYYILRIACAMCFIGHGSFGIIGKEMWMNYFEIFGIGHAAAWKLMPIVGIADIICGVIILFYPIKAVVIWLVFWGFITALLRPLSGESFFELLERAGNFGAPLALLIVCGQNFGSNIFKPLYPGRNNDITRLSLLKIILQVVVCLLLAGHGWLTLSEKKGILNQYFSAGFTDVTTISKFAGLFEIFAGGVILFHPGRFLLLILLAWKMSTELFYPHYQIFEWIERGGSYGCILALLMILKNVSGRKKNLGIKKQHIKVSSFELSSFNFSLIN